MLWISKCWYMIHVGTFRGWHWPGGVRLGSRGVVNVTAFMQFVIAAIVRGSEILSQVLSSPHNSPLLAAKYSALFCFLLIEFFNTFGRCLDDLLWPTWSAIKVCRPTFTCQCHLSEYWFSSSPAACLTGWSLRSWSVFTSGGATVRNLWPEWTDSYTKLPGLLILFCLV